MILCSGVDDNIWELGAMNMQELSNMFLNQYYGNMQNNRKGLLEFYS